jgi:SAM-dependent methyltransferase
MMFEKFLRRLLNRPVVYGEEFFKDSWFREWEALKDVLGSMIANESRWRRVLDFGCGPGIMIDHLNDRGIDCIGCDYSAEARALYMKRYGRHQHNYVRTLDELSTRDFDVLMAFDVFEHMTDEEITALIGQVKRIPELLLNISRTRGIPGHINLKSDRRWISFMRDLGYGFEEERSRNLRSLYAKLRPGAPDQWDKNLFLFRRVD